MSHVVRTWNTFVGMPSVVVAAVIRRHRDVDIWFLQEAHRRRRTLSGIPGYTLYMPVGLPGQSKQDRVAAGGNPILVRSDLDQRPLSPVRLKKRWRRRRMPGIHPPRTLTRVWVEGVEYVNGHAPEKFDAALPARIEFMGALRALFADGKPRVVGGDINGKSFERGPGFPADVITDHKLFVGNARPSRIDFFMGKGITFSGTKAASTREGSDHHAVQTTVTPLVVQPPDPEVPVPLTDADKAWIEDTVTQAVAGATVDVGKPNPWSDDKVAEVLLNSSARQEAALAELRASVAALTDAVATLSPEQPL